MRKVINFLVAILLLPVAVAASLALYQQLIQAKTFGNAQLAFFWGVGIYLLIHLVLHKPIRLYVFGHELTHAISSWICGGSVSSFSVSGRGGKIVTNRVNTFILLSPYLIPIYTVLITLAYFILSLFYSLQDYNLTFIFLVGFSLAFHLLLTIETLKTEQPDLLESGYLFSLLLIYITNLLLVSIILSLIFPEMSLQIFFQKAGGIVKNVYEALFRQLFAPKK